MAMILARLSLTKTASAFRLIGVSGPSVRSKSDEVSTTSTIPNKYDKNCFPDAIESTTGLEKKQLLALLQGDMRYEPKIYALGKGTKEQPNIVPCLETGRYVGCMCEPDQEYVNYMCINLDEMKRCECGYWFKCVKGDPDFF